MSKKVTLGPIGLILLALLVGACTPQQATQAPPKGAASPAASQPAAAPQRGGTLRMAWESEPAAFDPPTTAGGSSRRYEHLMFNVLVQTDENGNIVPELAESWSNPDPKTYLFKLRKDVKFHDGTPFNAAAVKFNIDRVMGPESIDVWRSQLRDANLQSVDVVDDYTVRFNLSAPMATLPAALTMTGAGAMSSPDAVKKWGSDYKLHPVGTGPFEFVEWVLGDHVTVKRFDGYWRKDDKGNALPYIDQIIIKPIPDITVRLTALRTGSVDLDDSILPSDLELVKADPNLQVVLWGNSRFDLMPNCAGPVFDNKALRQAVSWAVDRDAILQGILKGVGSPGVSGLDPRSWAFNPQLDYKRDLAKAKQKLGEGGKPNGFKFTAGVYNLPVELQVAQAVKGQLAEVGIELEVVPVETVAHVAAVGSGKVGDAAFYRGVGLPEDPGIEIRGDYHSKGAWNQSKCFSPDTDKLTEQAGAELDQGKRKDMYFKIQAVAREEAWRIPLFHSPVITAMSKKVQGFTPNINVYHQEYDWIWLQK